VKGTEYAGSTLMFLEPSCSLTTANWIPPHTERGNLDKSDNFATFKMGHFGHEFFSELSNTMF